MQCKYANACLFKKLRHEHFTEAHLECIYYRDREIIN